MHIRDAQGRHSLDVDGYREAWRVVREAVGTDMVVQITSEAAGVYRAPEQIAMVQALRPEAVDRKSTRLNSSHLVISYAVFCLKKKNRTSTVDARSARLRLPTSTRARRAGSSAT